uniref:Kin of IRRE-like protein 3-like n=1 Tax=Saccoglossus kowalevskii TaxID=10224 RepID=A0ABM0M157_SACKO|nr:PREDICTED: kin of IRRE-like protein 3-like [Saccoglossus kowalevskii]
MYSVFFTVLSQSFRGVPVDTVVLEGNEVLLNCSFNDFESTATVAWNRGQLSLYLGNKAGKVYADPDFDDCCEIVGNTQNYDFMLKIRNANFDDMAIWKCSYSETIILEEEAKITVLEGPPTCEVSGAGPENEVVEGRSDATILVYTEKA